MKTIGSLLALYLCAGMAIALLQAVLVETIEPSCHGIVEHRLWRKHQSCSEIESQIGLCKHDTSRGLISAVKLIVSWLPDAIGVAGDQRMTLKEYALAGYQCRKPVAIEQVLPPLIRPPSISTDRPPGSLAARLLAESVDKARLGTYVTLEPSRGVRLELPPSWRVLDEKGIESEMPTTGAPDAFRMRIYFPPEEPPQAQVSLIIAPSPLSAAEPLQGLTDTRIRDLARRFIRGIRDRMSAQGYRMPEDIDPQWTRTQERLTVRATFEAIAPQGQRLTGKHTWIVTPSRSVSFSVTFDQSVSDDLRRVLRHAEDSFAVSDG